jgi:large subunit ribosomal protein L25
VPGNVYGLERAPFMVAVDPRRVEDLLRMERGVNTIFTLTLAGETSRREAMIKELQRDPLTDRPLHIDFVRVDLTRKMEVAVPIRLVGTPTGVKNEDGILDFVHREVALECLPTAIPEFLSVDVSELHVHQHVSIKDLVVPEGVRILEDPEQIVATVAPPRQEELPVAAEEAATPAEPEVAKKGKEAEAEADPSAKAD